MRRAVADPLDARLAELDRDQLAAVVRRLVRHDQDLEDLVHLPLPGERTRVDPRRIRDQVTRIVRGIGWDWRASSRAETELWPIVTTGEQLVEQGAWADARTVFGTTIGVILRHYDEFRDNESEIAGIVGECVDGLGSCLEQPDLSSEDRVALMDEVLSVWIWDSLEQGGYGMSDPARGVLLTHASPEERRRLAARVRASLPSTDADYGRARRQRGGRFVLELVGGELSVVEQEELFTDGSLDESLMDLLFDQGRPAEAIALLRRTPQRDAVKLAARLVDHGLAREADLALLEHPSLLDPDSWALRRWLAEREVPVPTDLEEVVGAVGRFRSSPTIGHYRKLRAHAEAIGHWPDVLHLVEAVKADARAVRPVRARILAELGRVDEALAILAELTDSAWRSSASDVARSLETVDPTAAAELYRTLIAHLVDHDTKHSRQAAAEHQGRLDDLLARPASEPGFVSTFRQFVSTSLPNT